MYKRLYVEQLGITAYLDSSLKECKIKLSEELSKEPVTKINWFITGLFTTLGLLANWTIYVLLTK
jgi:hypothetical protein